MILYIIIIATATTKTNIDVSGLHVTGIPDVG
jgi:hypothetical protein